MQTNNKSVIITLSAILVAAFFMPWIKFFVSLSAWDMLFGEAGQYIDTGLKYIAILIPISGAIIIYGAAFNNENYPIAKGLLFRLPIITLVVLIIAITSKISDTGGRFRSSDLENITKIFGIGFWLTLVASIILPFLQSKPVTTKVSSSLKTNYSGKSKGGIALLIVGLILVIVSTQNQFFTKTSTYRVDPGAQGLPDAYNIMGPMYDTQTYIDTKKKNAFLYSGIAALLLGGLIFASGRSTTNLITNKSDNPPEDPINENQSSPQTVATPNYTRPQVNINLPKVNWDSTFAKAKAFLNKYKVFILSGAGVLIAFLIVYNLFIKADPVKDAKNLAKNYCACSEELNKNNLASLQSYSNEFDSKQFKSRMDARNSLNNILQENQTKYNNCTQSVNVKYTEQLADYNAKGGQNAYTFQQTYSSISNACNSTNSSDVVALQSQIDEKIKGIIDPEPDIEKIKADLIGKQILGWYFNNISEFKQASILNKATASDRIEYTVNLQSQPESNYNDAQIISTYLFGEGGWYLESVKTIYISFTNIAPVGTWLKVTPLANSNYSISNDKMFLIRDGEYGQTYKGGPDGESFHLTSSTIYIQSRETQPVNIVFTYRPTQ